MLLFPSSVARNGPKKSNATVSNGREGIGYFPIGTGGSFLPQYNMEDWQFLVILFTLVDVPFFIWN